MIYYLDREVDRQKFIFMAKKHLDNKARVELTKPNSNKTISQNNYIHFLFKYYGTQVGSTWREVEYDFMRTHPDLFRYEKNGREYYKSLSDSSLGKEEHQIMIDRFIEEAEINGILMPRPDNQEFIDEARNEIERAKEFLNR